MEYDLKVLQATAEGACKIAFEERQFIPGGVNWGDLHCVSAERCEDQDGNVRYQVLIEEVSPDAGTFQDFIREWLIEGGFPHVQVMTEW